VGWAGANSSWPALGLLALQACAYGGMQAAYRSGRTTPPLPVAEQ